ncbi:MAG TPA: glycerol-3-phosphate acyltransferase [Acidimicrobiales bacterium]|nr:glycerol-3-phosphate acyltransferase [Acidimicrobiales bacterium]
MLRTAANLAGAACLGYVAGTIPSADVAARLATDGAVDLRTAGSGNPGGANAVAVLGKWWGAAVIAADVAKAVAASVAGRRLAGDAGAHLAGVASVVGHSYPIWSSGERGGKGVACAAGQLAATFPAAAPVEIAVAGLMAKAASKDRARKATIAAVTAWMVASIVWWRRGLPNLWGPRPTAALPLAAAASGAVVVARFAAGRTTAPT